MVSFHPLLNCALTLGSKLLLEFIWTSAELSFWTSVIARNVEPMLDVLLHGASFFWTNITILTQGSCFESTYRDPQNPGKPIFLKDLRVFHNIKKLKSTEDALLIDDTPLKNLRNNTNSVVHPPSWEGASDDWFLIDVL